MDITVTFAPDHSSDHFSDFAHIELFGQVGSLFCRGEILPAAIKTYEEMT